MRLNGLRRNEDAIGDPAVAQTLSHQGQHFQLPSGERPEGTRTLRHQLFDQARIDDRSAGADADNRV